MLIGGDGGSNYDTVNYYNETVVYSGAYESVPQGVIVDLSAGAGYDTFGTLDFLVGIEVVYGTQYDDILIGGGNDDFESFRTFAGNDYVDGGTGWDRLDYAQYDNTYFVNIDIQTGLAELYVTASPSSPVATTSFQNINDLRGTGGNDSLLGSDNTGGLVERFVGLAGSDTFQGRAGTDEASYHNEHNHGGSQGITVAAHSSIVDAFEITDTFGDIDAAYDIENIRGSVFSDTIIGNSGNNRLRGGLSADVMSGGAGNDVFVFAAGENDAADTITDFSLLDDALDLAGLLDAAFTPGAASDYVQASTSGSDTVVSVDSDGAANGANFVDVALLSGISAGNVTFVYDDASSTSTVTIT